MLCIIKYTEYNSIVLQVGIQVLKCIWRTLSDYLIFNKTKQKASMVFWVYCMREGPDSIYIYIYIAWGVGRKRNFLVYFNFHLSCWDLRDNLDVFSFVHCNWEQKFTARNSWCKFELRSVYLKTCFWRLLPFEFRILLFVQQREFVSICKTSSFT